MNLFMLLAAAMLLLALAFLIVPLVRATPPASTSAENLAVLTHRLHELDADLAAARLAPDEHEQARRELERQALQADAEREARRQEDGRGGWAAALVAGIVLPLGAVAMYVAVGQPAALSDAVLARADARHEAVDEAIQALSRRLETDGDDAQGWVLLARSYLAGNRIADAVGAYRKASTLMPDNADLLVEYANTLAIANHRNLAGKPQELVERALRVDPDNLNALALAGATALQGGNREEALKHWTKLEGLLEPGSPDRPRIAALIARARGQAPVVAGTAPPAAARPPATAAHPMVKGPADAARVADASAGAGAQIRGTVTIDAALANQVAPTDTLYVFARAPSGPPMPVAAVRLRAGAWPVSFTLDDSSAMAAGRALSAFKQVNIVARVSRLGSANAQPGDIEGRVENVAPGRGDVRIVMDRVIGQ